jgi:hypothetical protein
MENPELWKSMLDTLKDIAGYLEKQDAIQERAKVDEPPKARETQKPMAGGAPAPNKPGEGIAKEYVTIPDNAKKNSQKTINEGGTTELDKAADGKDDEKDDDVKEASDSDSASDSDTDGKEKSDDEIKSLLKDIRSALVSKSNDPADIEAVIKAELKKAVPAQLDKMLRKMGFNPTRPDVVRYGIDQTADVAKSEDKKAEGDIRKSDDDIAKDIASFVGETDRNGHPVRSFPELGQLREKMGLFKAF